MKINKFNKKKNEIQKKIINIINKKFNFIIKKNLININYIKIYKNYSIIKIYISSIKKIKKINKIKNFLQKKENIIKIKLKKIINFKYIPKILFKIDNFYNKNKKLFNILNIIKK